MSPRILVVGAGAVGGYFGAHLARAGRDVTFLLRPERAEFVRREGLTVRTSTESFTVHPAVVTADELATFDIVLLAVKAFGFEAAVEDLAPAVGESTLVIPALNGMRHLDVLRERFGDERVLGGYAFISATLDGPHIVQLYGEARLTYGRLDGATDAAVERVHAAFDGAGFRAKLSSRIELEMWEKWTMLASGGAVTCLFRGDVGAIVAAGGARYGRDAVLEIAAIARASGFEPRAHVVDDAAARLEEPGSPFTTSMYRDLVQGLDVESDHIVGDLVVRARGFGIPVPVLEAALVALTVYRASRVS